MKKLLLSLCMLLLAATLLGTSSYAWFSMNKTADVEGIMVKAKADSSLVIASTLPTSETSSRKVDLDESTATLLQVCTHDSTYATYSNGLKRVTNTGDINEATGRANTGKTLSYGTVTNDTSNTYYKDYIFYLAGSGGSVSLSDGNQLKITLNTITKSIQSAISVDFYMSAVSAALSKSDDIVKSANYAGTLNLGGVQNKSDTESEAYASIAIHSGTTFSLASIPNAAVTTGNKAVAVVCRVYADGNLIDAETTGSGSTLKNYIRNAEAVNLQDTEVKINFLVEAKPSK